MFLFLFLSLILFHGQSIARAGDITAVNKHRHSNDSLVKIDARKKWSVRIADSFIERYPAFEIYDSIYGGKWTSGQGVVLEALQQLWLAARDVKYLTYIKSNIDMFIGGDGSIRTYNYNDFNLENINTGRQLLFLYSVTKNKKYKIAADTLMKQLKNQPRTNAGGFWHKKDYPFQMRLESLYMCEPFYSQYSKMFRGNFNFDDIAHQLILTAEKMRDEKTGLLCCARDECLLQKWADPKTERAPNFLAPDLGWYTMALVDVLDYFPKNHPKRKELIGIFRDLSLALAKVRDENCRLWYQVIDQGAVNGNCHDASARCMFGYAFAKGANKGYLDRKYLSFAKETFYDVASNLAGTDESLAKNLSNLQRIGGLKGVGTLILMAIELEKAHMLKAEKLAYKKRAED